MMKNVTAISAILIAVYVFLCSCSNSENDLVPSLSHDVVSIEVGASKVITVANATNVSVTSASSLISLAVTGNQITITALKVGETTIRVNADGTRLQCKVTVVGGGGDEPENPDEPETPNNDDYSYEKELQDATSRYISDDISLKYDQSGVVFAVESNGFIAFSLDYDERVCLTFDGDVAVGALNNPHLTVNDVDVEVSEARIEQINEHGTWIHIIATTQEHIVFVVTDI